MVVCPRSSIIWFEIVRPAWPRSQRQSAKNPPNSKPLSERDGHTERRYDTSFFSCATAKCAGHRDAACGSISRNARVARNGRDSGPMRGAQWDAPIRRAEEENCDKTRGE